MGVSEMFESVFQNRSDDMTSYDRRVFSYAGSHAWNLLTENVQKSTPIAIFKHSLKTFLFIIIIITEIFRVA